LLALLPATAAALCFAYLDGGARARVWLWLCGAAVLSALLGILQLAAGGEAYRFYRETSPDSAVGIFANRNHQAAFLACALPLLGAVTGLRTIERPSRHWLWLAAGIAAVLELGILATASRSGLVLGAVGLAAAIWSFRASGAGWGVAEGRSRALLFAAGLVALVAAIFAATRLGVADRLAHTDPAGEMRFQMIAPLIETARAFFPWGSGFGSFETVYRQFEPDVLLSTIYMNQAHNELLQLAIEGGLPALLLLASFLWWWAATALRIVHGDLSRARRGTALAAVAITAMLLAESLVDYPLRTPLLGSLFAIACVEMIRARSTARLPGRNGLRQS
jgi:O-antigen ligase